LLDFLYTAISWVMLRWHDLFVWVGLPTDGGLSWALSIMFLVITLRVAMFRFFVKQVKTQRAMQELQPKIQELRKKYKDDRQTLSREIMALQQEAGVNMLAGCLPILLQAPVFISLFHVLKYIAPGHDAKYSWTAQEMISAGKAKLFGAPIAASFNTPDRVVQLGGSLNATRAVTLVLIICMVTATYLTQRMIMNRSVTQMDAQQAMIQKLMLYGMPASLAVSGFFFPIGILVYWFTNNIWTLGQQFYILRRMPVKTPTGAEKKPAIDPKLLAPKPGAKPLHPKNRRAQSAATGDGSEPKTTGGAGTDKPTAPEKATPPGGSGGTAKANPTKSGTARAGAAGSGDGAATGGTASSADGTRRTGSANGSPAKRTPAKSGGGRPRSGKKRRR
jgi:YidC/Oxa1 family membrane protein insertase